MKMNSVRNDAEQIIKESIQSVLPDKAVAEALKQKEFENGNIYVIAAGKAAWQMAKKASEVLEERITKGIVCTKYGHVKGEIPKMICYEGGHPIPDENSFIATRAALKLVKNLNEKDTVIFLLSGGGSALFEVPLVSGDELKNLTDQLLACGANIMEINTIRKRLSAVKGGKFAKLCEPAAVYSIVLSDVLGDQLDVIASGPTCPDSSTCEDAFKIVEKYQLHVSEKTKECLMTETPKNITNVETVITGSVSKLCEAAEYACANLGYRTIILTDQLNCQAREAGLFLAAIAKSHQESRESLAFVAGGETVVHLTGQGKGGRNQELALAAAEEISGLKNTAIFSVGSDGTDGPTDAAGGYCDGNTRNELGKIGISIFEVLKDNDAYHALEKTDGLIKTGATGTNVNDVAVVLIKR